MMDLKQILLIFLFLPMISLGQFFSVGEEPPHQGWMKLEGEGHSILFPEGYKSVAQRMDSLFSAEKYPRFGQPVRKTPVILHPQSLRPNAFVTWAPRRMEFFIRPTEDSYADPWVHQLARHEQAHVEQLSAIEQSWVKRFSWIFGEMAAPFFLGMYVPYWFLEGDGVEMETLLSQSGRGRDPAFEMLLKAQVMDKGTYSYDKAVLGSYRSFVPNQYILGYHLVTFGRVHYGNPIWADALSNIARKPLSLTPFNRAIRDHSGLNKRFFYQEAIRDWKQYWISNHAPVAGTGQRLSPEKKVFTDYLHPARIGNDSVIALRYGLEDPTTVVLITAGKEQMLRRTARLVSTRIIWHHNRIWFTEELPDPRWPLHQRTRIVSCQLNGKDLQVHLKNTDQVLADIAEDGTMLLYANKPDQRTELFLLKGNDTLHRLLSKPFEQYQYPMFGRTFEEIVFVSASAEGMLIRLHDFNANRYENLTPRSYDILGWMDTHEEGVLFTSSASGKQQVYFRPWSGDRITKVTEAPYGASYPGFDPEGGFLYSGYSADGYQLMHRRNREEALNNSSSKDYYFSPLLGSVVRQPAKKTSTKTVEPYRPGRHLFHFHSWGPVAIDMNQTSLDPGISIHSQNLLSTLFLSAGYRWNVADEFGSYYLNAEYRGWLPVVATRLSYSQRNASGRVDGEPVRVHWDEVNASATLSIPNNLSRGAYYRYLTPYLTGEYIYTSPFSVGENRIGSRTLPFAGAGILFSNMRRSVARDMNPTLGQRVEVRYQRGVFPGDQSYRFWVNSSFYFPGIFRHQSFFTTLAYQKRLVDEYLFSTDIPVARGYFGFFPDEVFTARINYKLPVIYPDFSLGALIYLKRVKLNAFYDQSWGNQSDWRSLGGELTADMHFFRLPFPVDTGFRLTRRLSYNDYYAEVLLNISF